jgi:hypothetical protein
MADAAAATIKTATEICHGGIEEFKVEGVSFFIGVSVAIEIALGVIII